METGLEVEAAKVVVLQQVAKLMSNMSRLEQSLQKTDNDVDYLYSQLYGVNRGCAELTATVAQLEASVANVTALANENRLALESDADVEEWGRPDDWEPLVATLQQEVQQVKQQTRTHTYHEVLSEVVIVTTQVKYTKCAEVAQAVLWKVL